MDFLKIYLIAFIIFLLIDLVWLSTIATDFYKKHLGYLMKEKPNLWAALVFYLIFIGGLVYLVILPSVNDGNFIHALFGGAVFGLVGYSTYDLTNLATVKNWPIKVTIVDLIWGTFLSTAISSITYLLYNLFW